MRHRPALRAIDCSIFFASIVMFFVDPLHAQTTPAPLPAGGQRLISVEKAAPDQLRVNLGGGKLGEKKVLDVDHAAFSKSLQVQLTAQPKNTWDTSISTQTTEAVKKDDALLIGFWARGKSMARLTPRACSIWWKLQATVHGNTIG